MITRNTLDPAKFNPTLALPFELRQQDFRATVQDVYDFFFDVNTGLTAKGWSDRVWGFGIGKITLSRSLGSDRACANTPSGVQPATAAGRSA